MQLHLTGPKGEESVEVRGNLSADEMGFVLKPASPAQGSPCYPWSSRAGP